MCAISNAAQQSCADGTCIVLQCTTGYKPASDRTSCTLYASGRARAKRHGQGMPRAPTLETLCPAGEQACPIAGSSAYAAALSQQIETGEAIAGLLAVHGGCALLVFISLSRSELTSLSTVECLDTLHSLESCGGCVATGQGKDCTRIAHAESIGCEEGRCVVHSCRAPFRPSLKGDTCIAPLKSYRARHAHHHAHDDTAPPAVRANYHRPKIHDRGHGLSHP